MTYVPLDVRTEYSFLEALCRVPALVERARAFRFEALGVADLHSVLGLPRFALAARAAGLRPLLGARVRLHADLPSSCPWGSGCPEMLLYATDARGYGNLLQLVSLAHVEEGHGEPGVTLEDLDNARAGLLALDGGHAGPLCRTLSQAGPEAAARLAARLREIFGAGNFFVQVQRHGEQAEIALEPYLLHLARAQNLPVLAANETRYLDVEEARQYEVLRCFAAGRGPAEPSRQAVRPRQHLRSPVEMQHLFRDLPEALANTRLVAERCQFELELGIPRAPEFATDSGRHPFAELRRQCEHGACERYGKLRYQDVPAMARDRIHHELARIAEKKLASCFLLVQDVVRHASEEGVPMGPGRGGLAGSLVAYVLGLTDIEPLERGLHFEAFLPGTTTTLPEFELDVGHRGRERLLEHLKRRYGHERLGTSAVVERLSARAAVRMAAVAQGLEENEAVAIDQLLLPVPARAAKSRGRHAWRQNPELRAVLEVAVRLEGLAQRLTPSHSGLLLAAAPLVTAVGIERRAGSPYLAQATDEDASVLGLLRLRLEASRAVSLQAQTVELIRERSDRPWRVASIGLDDERTYRQLASGATLGIPGLENPRLQGLLQRLQPARFADLVTALAVDRRGAAGAAGNVEGDAAARWPELEARLRSTHGFLLFEEQVTELATTLAGYDAEAAESLRAAVAQRSWRDLGRQRARFLSGAVERGAALQQAETLFDRLVAAQGTLVSQARTTGLALLAYRAAFLAAHHPLEFFATLLDLSTGQSARAAGILREAVERQIKLLDVDINRSAPGAMVDRDAIRLGLVQVRHIGESLAARIVACRDEHGRFETLVDFRRRLPEIPERAIASLVAAGAFESLGIERSARVAVQGGARQRRQPVEQLALPFMAARGAAREKPTWGAEKISRRLGGTARRAVPQVAVGLGEAGTSEVVPAVTAAEGSRSGYGNAETVTGAAQKLWIVGRIRARA